MGEKMYLCDDLKQPTKNKGRGSCLTYLDLAMALLSSLCRWCTTSSQSWNFIIMCLWSCSLSFLSFSASFTCQYYHLHCMKTASHKLTTLSSNNLIVNQCTLFLNHLLSKRLNLKSGKKLKSAQSILVRLKTHFTFLTIFQTRRHVITRQ